MPDTIFIFALALVIFGPKKLPEIGRQLGKLVGEFRRASNEFKMQIEEELRDSERSDRQKQLALDAIAPPAATVETQELPASLTVKPPSTGEVESAESPFKPYDIEEIEASQPRTYSEEKAAYLAGEGEPRTYSEEKAAYLAREEGGYDREDEAYGRVEEAYEDDRAYGREEKAYGERADGLEDAPQQPDAPALSDRPATPDGAAAALEEQATNHHG